MCTGQSLACGRECLVARVRLRSCEGGDGAPSVTTVPARSATVSSSGWKQVVSPMSSWARTRPVLCSTAARRWIFRPLALLGVAADPPLGRRGRDLEAFGAPAQGPAVLDDAAGQTQATGLGQGRITVGHEGLLNVRV
jgi:hypothetical protein